MKKLFLGALLGATFTGVVSWFVLLQPAPILPSDAAKVDSILDRIEAQEPSVSEPKDEDSPVVIQSINDILKIKSDFKQTEMLYILAGQAQPRKLIALIKQADLIDDASDRSYTLNILFSRLTEINPELALEAATDERFVGDENVARTIWRTWARQDFDAALLAVAKLTPLSRKELAAQAMYWAVGVFGNDKTDHIKKSTGVSPTRWAVTQAIEKIARRSIPEAISTINKLHSVKDQRHTAYAIAVMAVNRAPDLALTYTGLFSSGKAADHYRSTVLRTIGSNSPETVLQNWRAENYNSKTRASAHSALAQYAIDDFEQAMAYVDQLPDFVSKKGFIKVLLAVKSRVNAVDAMRLAQQYEQAGHKGLLSYLVSEMIKVSPPSALRVLDALPEIPNHKHYVAQAVGGLAELDPEQAISKIQLLTDTELRSLANQKLLTSWALTDVNAALNYALTLEGLGDELSLNIALKGADLDLAMRFMNKFSDADMMGSLYTLTADLANRYNASELISKLQPYRSNAQFDKIKTHLLSAIQNASIADAQAFIETFWQGEEKAEAYLTYAQTLSYQKPESALQLLKNLEKIEDQQLLFSSIMSAWVYRDKSSARRKVESMPAGRLRDTGVSAFAPKLSPSSKRDMELLESIQDQSVREQAVFDMLAVSANKGDDVIVLGRSLGLSNDKLALLELTVECRNLDYRSLESRKKCRNHRYRRH